jgi:hypothetical protein
MQRGKTVLQEMGWRDDEFDWQWTAVESEAEARAALSSDAIAGWDLESGVGVVRVRASSDRRWQWYGVDAPHHWRRVVDGRVAARLQNRGERGNGVAVFKANVGVCRVGVGAAAARVGEAMSAWWRSTCKGARR